MQSLAQNLYTVSPKYAAMNQSLFARHLTGLSPAMTEDDLEAQIAADKLLQEQLRGSAGFGGSSTSDRGGGGAGASSISGSNNSKKRRFDPDTDGFPPGGAGGGGAMGT